MLPTRVAQAPATAGECALVNVDTRAATTTASRPSSSAPFSDLITTIGCVTVPAAPSHLPAALINSDPRTRALAKVRVAVRMPPARSLVSEL